MHSTFHVIGGDQEHELWTAYRRRPWQDPGIVVRASWLPGRIEEMLSMLRTLAGGLTVEMTGRIGVGAGLFRLEGRREAQVDAVARMRASQVFGNVVVLRAPIELKSRDWVWGPGPGNSIGTALKQELDPHGVLGAGRGPL
jgi:hypothetical protein